MSWWMTQEGMLQAVRSYGNPTQAARMLGGIGERQARDIYKRMTSAGYASSSEEETTVAASEPADIIELRRQIDRLTKNNQDLRKQLSTGIAEANLLDEIRALIDPVIESYPSTVKVASKSSLNRSARRREPVEIIVYLTDWHVGEQIDPSDVQGLNEYNIDIAARRVEHVALVVEQWRENYEQLHGVSRVTYGILGDMVNNAGQLHPDQSQDYAGALVQSLDASLLMYQCVKPTIESGTATRIVTTRGGNHGRSTKKMPSGPSAAQTSWDGVAYEHLGALLRGSDVEWHMSRAYSATIDVAGKTFWLAHGDAIKGGGGSLGIPAYGAKRHSDAAVMASVLDAIRRSAPGVIVEHVRTGHFHEEVLIRLPTGSFKICPSIKGTSAWELDTLGKVSRPEALIEVVHPDHGIISSHVIDCSNPQGDGFVHGALQSLQPAAMLV